MTKVLITGGTGFIGSNLALRHRADGDDVVVLAKTATEAERENAADLEKAGVRLVIGSVTEPARVEEAMRGVTIVHHIAAAMREANIPDQVFWDVNVEATRRLLQAARAAGVLRFVYCSSIGAMGKTPAKPAGEESPCDPRDIYQKTKRAAEELCLEFHRAHAFPLSIVRPAEVYGPRDRRLLKLFRTIARGTFMMIGDGRNEHHLVYIDDMVQGFRLAATHAAAAGQIFIIAGEHPVRLEDLVRVVARQLQVKEPRWRLPLLPIRLAAAVVEDLCAPFGIQPPIYRRRVDFFRSDYAFDIGKARRILGYRPEFDVETGVRRTMEWYRQRGLI